MKKLQLTQLVTSVRTLVVMIVVMAPPCFHLIQYVCRVQTGIGKKPAKRKSQPREKKAPKKPRLPARRSLRAKGLAPDGVTAAHVAHEQLKVTRRERLLDT